MPATVEAPPTNNAPPGPERRRRRKRRGVLVAAVVLVFLAAGGVAGATLLGVDLGGGDARKQASTLPPNTAEVTRQTLTDSETADGTLDYGPTSTLTGRLAGTVTWLPDTDDEVTRGKPLYKVDNDPVVLMYGSMPAYRTLEPGIEGRDVKQLERNLRKLGYTGFTVDDEYTDATADAVSDWQDDKGLEETGVVELGRVVFAPSAVRVDSLQAAEGDPAKPGQQVLTHTRTAKAVTVELDVEDQRLAKKGAKVDVTLPDDTTVSGRVDEVSTVVESGESQDEQETKVEVTVDLSRKKAQRAAASYALAAVDVDFTAEQRKDVLTVPVAALVALQEGGFGVEVVDGSTTRYVPVETGLFAGGRVEVSGDGIAEGTKVGMPK